MGRYLPSAIRTMVCGAKELHRERRNTDRALEAYRLVRLALRVVRAALKPLTARRPAEPKATPTPISDALRQLPVAA
ncbi:hypothetical protein [Streptomyces sp. NPDC051569]|uniref:hypothetical protein n=1 Tax=Streptomyces sp. NPDC051569 TaxID=3365661 RepID=UPI00378B3594